MKSRELRTWIDYLKIVVGKWFVKKKKSARLRIQGFSVVAFNYTILLHLFKEIFMEKQYYFESRGDQPVILDCGANVGMASDLF